jgi:hypothetical protein
MKLPRLDLDRLRPRRGSSSSKDIKAPKVVRDLYADLRDRRLIPVVILLVVAIIAAPLLLSKGGKSGEEVSAVPTIEGSPSSEGGFSVVPAAHKLRAYGDRLGYRKARNPFLNGAEKSLHKAHEEEAEGKSTGGATAASSETSGGTSEGGSTRVETITRTITKTPKVVKANIQAQVGVLALVKAGYVGSNPQELKLEPQSRLPEKNVAVIYTGYSKKGGALFLMTSQVSEFSGEGRCVVGGSLCQVVELMPKHSETFAIGYGKTRYEIRLVGFESVIEEGVVEYEGKKVRFPEREEEEAKQGKSGGSTHGGSNGKEPAPRDGENSGVRSLVEANPVLPGH